MSYRQLNNIIGWSVGGFALIVYLLTVAPTASFWDCGEFIACSNELEVTHPPGAPLFLLLGRLMALLAPDVTTIAFMVNLLSVISSAFTVVFTCWITTYLAKKSLKLVNWNSQYRVSLPLLAGVVAGLVCTFTDTIWFNAVEAEVYAMSSFFTALVIWLMVKWEARADRPDHLKWIILIAYVMGLSIGVHLLNLLTIPALGMMYYLRKFPFSWKGFSLVIAISVGILGFIQYGIIQFTFSLAWTFEKMFTGTASRSGIVLDGWGLPMGTGTFILALLIVITVIGLLVYSHIKKLLTLNIIVLSYIVIMIGFSSYITIFIRSNVDPPIDMNNPENILSFLSYMKREQYGNRPLLRGPMYHANIIDVKAKGKKYMLLDGKDRYVVDTDDREYVYEEDAVVWFPRMYEAGRYNLGPHAYRFYVNDQGDDLNNPYDDHPTRGEDILFFLDYQLYHMYIRYFLWNFVGRQSDEQHAAWEDGLFFNTPLDNKANNHYFYLPLLLGIFGLIWHYFNDSKNTLIFGLLFFFTGVAIIIYLNQYPAQPRERDYSFAGSFQIFTIWIGLGMLPLFDWLRAYLKQWSMHVIIAIGLFVPFLMAFQNWDDHSRKGRYVDIEFAKNLLNSCAQNGILFTGGDNDTFPLWYIQEVEGFRTDVRVINLELLISDWYIDQMKQEKNGALPVPISMNRADYAGERDLVIRDYPSKIIKLPVDKEYLWSSQVIDEAEWAMTADSMEWEFPSRGSQRNPYILRKDSVIINILHNVANNQWKRPVYFSNTMSQDNFLNLQDYFRLEGMAYRVLPVKRSEISVNDLYYGRIDQERMFQHLTEDFFYSELNNPKVYFDEHIRNVIVSNYRNSFFRLASTYADQIQTLAQDLNRSTGSEEDSLADNSFYEESIRKNQIQIKKLMDFVREKVPEDVIQEPLGLSISKAQMYQQSFLMQEADSAYHITLNKALDRLIFYHENDIPLDMRDLSFRSSLLTVQYLAQTQRKDSAISLAEQIKELTGSDLPLELLNK